MHRKFQPIAPNNLWVNVIAGIFRGKELYCGTVLDMFIQKIAGRSIDNCQDATLISSDLECRDQESETASPGALCTPLVGVQFTFWIFTSGICSAALVPSFGTSGDGQSHRPPKGPGRQSDESTDLSGVKCWLGGE